MKIGQFEIQKITDFLWEIPPSGKMRVPARVYSSQKMLETHVAADNALVQLVNVATLPGIQKYALAMPDIHWGYGFPIGGVAAFDVDEGIVSPGGVGYDINCGVRLAVTSLRLEKVRPKLQQLVHQLFQRIPTGVGSSGAIQKLSAKELKKVLEEGAHWAIEQGFGYPEDLEMMEEKGRMEGVHTEAISNRAIERGRDEVGTLGSGNHFLEVDVVDAIYDEKLANALGVFKNQIVVLIHTGSRGFGYQVCDDFLKEFNKASVKYGIQLVDRQLACAPIQSKEGQRYINAMFSAANYAWANRQVIMHLARQVFQDVFGMSQSDLQFRLLYDVAHNIAKFEEYEIGGKRKRVLVHRKGATRSFGKNMEGIPEAYRNLGQPVIIPGDMGRYSFLAVGLPAATEETFGSTCHGAGRLQSRRQAMKTYMNRDLKAEMEKYGVIVQAKGKRTIAEEMPNVYKDVSEVVEVMHKQKISKKIARLKPLGVIKG
jgi:tRNA-splicing ligase RtcB